MLRLWRGDQADGDQAGTAALDFRRVGEAQRAYHGSGGAGGGHARAVLIGSGYRGRTPVMAAAICFGRRRRRPTPKELTSGVAIGAST